MAKVTLGTVSSGYGTIDTLNTNFQRLVTAIDNTLSRDGTGPNAMGATLDMNSNRVINLAQPVGGSDAVRLVDLQAASVATDLPTQAGNAGKVLKTDGAAVGWQTAGEVIGNETGAATDMLPYFTSSTALGLLGPLTSVGKALLVLASYAALRTAADVPSRTEMAVQDAVVASLAIPRSTIVAKGDLVVGDAAGNPIRLAPGSNGQVPITDSAQPGGYTFVKLGGGDVRQSVLFGDITSTGYSNVLDYGSTAKYVNINAATIPLVVTYASGFGSQGAQDFVASISGSQQDVALGENGRWSFVYSEYVSPTSHVVGSTFVPPFYDRIFPRKSGVLLNFNGTDAATSTVDEWGNPWTFSGNAQLDTAQAKFGSSSLLLDGAGDSIICNNIQSPPSSEGWEVSLWFRAAVLPTAGTSHCLFHWYNVAGFGLKVELNNTAGTYRLRYYWSSDGSTWNLLAATNGSTTTGWAIDTWYKLRVVWGAAAFAAIQAFLSNNGAGEVLDMTSTPANSNVQICDTWDGALRIGTTSGSADFWNGWIDAFEVTPHCGPVTAQTPSGSPPTMAEKNIFFFSVPLMTMYKVTGPSSAANTDPVLTPKNIVFLGQFYTNATVTVQVVSYAFRGYYVSVFQGASATGGNVLAAHNLGYPPEWYESEVTMLNTRYSATGITYPGWQYRPMAAYVSGTYEGSANPVIDQGRTLSNVVTGNVGFYYMDSAGSTIRLNAATSFKYRSHFKRRF